MDRVIKYYQKRYHERCQPLIDEIKPHADKWRFYWNTNTMSLDDARRCIKVAFGRRLPTLDEVDEKIQETVDALTWQLETFKDSALMAMRLAASDAFSVGA